MLAADLPVSGGPHSSTPRRDLSPWKLSMPWRYDAHSDVDLRPHLLGHDAGLASLDRGEKKMSSPYLDKDSARHESLLRWLHNSCLPLLTRRRRACLNCQEMGLSSRRLPGFSATDPPSRQLHARKTLSRHTAPARMQPLALPPCRRTRLAT